MKKIIELTDTKDKEKMVEFYRNMLLEDSKLGEQVTNYLTNIKCISKKTLEHFNVGAGERWIYKDNEWVKLYCYVLFCSMQPFSYIFKPISQLKLNLDKKFIYGGKLNFLGDKNIKIQNRNSSTLCDIDTSDKVIISESFFDMMSIYDIKKKDNDYATGCLNSNINIEKIVNDIVCNDIMRNKEYYIIFNNNTLSINKSQELYDELNSLNFSVKNITEDVFGKTFSKYANCNEILTEDKKKLQRRIYRFIK